MTIITQPDEYSLSSNVKSFMIGSSADISFEILQGAFSILKETYTPDASQLIEVRDLGRFFDNYLAGSYFGALTHPGIYSSFTVKIDGVALDRVYKVMKCRAYTVVAATEFTSGNVFLNLLKNTKTITRLSKEYVTAKLSGPISVFLTVATATGFENTAEVVLDATASGVITTLDVSFIPMTALFPAIDKSTVVAIRVKIAFQIQVLLVDRANYLVPLNFMFKNAFDVPETVTTRGNVYRKGGTTFDTAKINRVEQKYNVERVDTFEVNSGKIFSASDYDRYREMFNSEDVRIYFIGAWRKVIIQEEDSTVSLRAGNLTPVSFTFRFADAVDNRILMGDAFLRWILEYGKFEEDKVWVDEGQWLDS